MGITNPGKLRKEIENTRNNIDKTHQQAERLFSDSIYYINQKKGGAYTYKSVSKGGVNIDTNLPEPVKQYLFMCSVLEEQIARLQSLKDDVTYIDNSVRLNAVKEKRKQDLQKFFKEKDNNKNNNSEPKQSELLKKVDTVDKVDSEFMLNFLQKEYHKMEKEFQGSQSELRDKKQALEVWIKAGEPSLQSVESIKAAIREDSFEEDEEDQDRDDAIQPGSVPAGKIPGSEFEEDKPDAQNVKASGMKISDLQNADSDVDKEEDWDQDFDTETKMEASRLSSASTSATIKKSELESEKEKEKEKEDLETDFETDHLEANHTFTPLMNQQKKTLRQPSQKAEKPSSKPPSPTK